MLEHQVAVERLDGQGVDDRGLDALGGQQLRGPQRLGHEDGAQGDQGHVAALAKHLAAAELEPFALRVERRYRLAVQAQVDATGVRGACPHQGAERYRVGGFEHGQRGDGAHDADVLEGHVRAAVQGGRYTGVGAHQLDVQPRVVGGEEELVEAATAGEAGERRGERDLARHGEACRHAHHVGLGHADVERPPRVRGGEWRRAGGFHQIGLEEDDRGILGGELLQRLRVDGPHFLLRVHAPVLRCVRLRPAAARWRPGRWPGRRPCCGWRGSPRRSRRPCP